jgi:hypothetical protein
MNEQEYEDFQHEQEIELMDLEIPREDDPKEHNGAAASSSDSVLVSLHSQRTSRQRRRRLILTASVIVLVVLVILGSSAATRNAALGFFLGRAPTPAPLLIPSTDLFYTEGIPPWGHLLVDGHSVALLPIDSVNKPLRLARGHHSLLVIAEPFQPIRCSISVPLARTDTCHLTTTDQQLLSRGWHITFFESLANLPIAERAALIQATQAELDKHQSTDQVQPGEQFVHVGVSHAIDTATQPLQATLRFHLVVPSTLNTSCASVDKPTDPSCSSELQHCYLFCPLAGESPLLSTLNRQYPLSTTLTSWNVEVAMLAYWSYNTLDNKVVATDQPDTPPDIITIDEHLVTLGITWEGERWHVAVLGPIIQAGNVLACIPAEDNFAKLLLPGNTTVDYTFTAFQFASGPVSASGCLIVAQQLLRGTAEPTSHTPVAYCLYRFGLFLAANDVAHHLWPQIPVANAYQQTLAQHLIITFNHSKG